VALCKLGEHRPSIRKAQRSSLNITATNWSALAIAMMSSCIERLVTGTESKPAGPYSSSAGIRGELMIPKHETTMYSYLEIPTTEL
jgi:hypothetical protein